MEDIKKSQSISELRSVYDMMSLKGKKALVTGAAGGIGRTTATALAEVGADVALMDIPAKQDLLEKYCRQIADLLLHRPPCQPGKGCCFNEVRIQA